MFQTRKGEDATAAESGTCFSLKSKHLATYRRWINRILLPLAKDYHHGQGRPGNSQAAKESQKACSKGSIQRQRTAAASSITIAAIVQGPTESTSTCKRSIGIVHCNDVQRKYSSFGKGLSYSYKPGVDLGAMSGETRAVP